MTMHLTWSQAAYDPFDPPLEPILPTLPTLPGRPLVYQVAGCWDCGWSAMARTYAEITDARESHAHAQLALSLPDAPVPATTRDVSEDVAA
jgi:hypothetical protein